MRGVQGEFGRGEESMLRGDFRAADRHADGRAVAADDLRAERGKMRCGPAFAHGFEQLLDPFGVGVERPDIGTVVLLLRDVGVLQIEPVPRCYPQNNRWPR